METPAPKKSTPKDVLVLRWLVGIVLGVLLLGAAWLGYSYAYSPEPIREPAQIHQHLRFQLINDGKAIDFAQGPYQTPFDKDMCSADLTKEPFHFHDGKDQFLHLHWKGLTGGLLLKHYGWNFIGGPDDVLGYQFDGMRAPKPVAVHGQALPEPPKGAQFFVYIGDKDSQKRVEWDAFLSQSLDKLLAGTSHENHDAASADLARIHDLLGNVVIFAQSSQPTSDQVKDRFNQLAPLPESSCAG
jgi:hypothetical protein